MPKVRESLRSLGNSDNRPAILAAIMAELIHVEMDLRVADGDHFQKREYQKRFPDYEIAIGEAWKRLGDLYPEADLFSTALFRTQFLPGPDADSNDDLTISEDQRCSIPQIFGPFRNIEKLDEGGFGVVCKALDSRTDQWIALKFPHRDILHSKELLGQFQEEANRVIELRHQGIVETHSIEFHDGYIAIAMQLIVGSSLKKTISDERTQNQIAQIVAKIADALAYAHQKGVIHRDLTPANILLDQEGEPFVTDFGLSLHENDQPFFPDEQCGKPPYMSPQLVEGLTRNLDGRTDIWSLGVILYEMLARKRPFRGVSRHDIFEQIETRDPRPLRESNPTVDHELQRICLKCLSRSTRERYMTADDLAEDLRHWLDSKSNRTDSEELISDVVPRGLRSYEKEDSDFYLSLLPGPYDRNGVPSSVRFWTRILNSTDSECEPVPVGVIFGPSGSGKSSLIKAAILPRLLAISRIVYVESTRDDTEVRLLKAIRRIFPDVPNGLALPELFRGLAGGLWNPQQEKIVVILDQFEQRLSVNDNYDQSQIAKALRHCDGDKVQCLLVARDGFWLSLTRFADSLEIYLHEGRNCQAIDLFDQQHARKVLRKLGHAFGKLPSDTSPLSDEQNLFLDMTIDQLANNHFVVCIQLSIFAEMFKSREWIPSELNDIGGVEGAGESFLEYCFGEHGPHPKYKAKKEQARLVLEALLPEPSSNIRGVLLSESMLRDASSCTATTEFSELVQILDDELRLISKTHPDRGNQLSKTDSNSTNFETHYQLTHDYLVPSIRNWLDQLSYETAKGRTRSRFKKLAKSWEANHDDRFLPTPMEYVSAVRFLKFQELKTNEKKLLTKANWYYLWRLLFFTVIVSTLVTLWVSSANKDTALARSHAVSFLVNSPDTVPSNVDLMLKHRDRCERILLDLQDAAEPDEKARQLRIQIGLVQLGGEDPELFDSLVNSISEANDDEGRNILISLRMNPVLSKSLLKSRFEILAEELRAVAETESQKSGALTNQRATLARLAVALVATNGLESIESFTVAEDRRVFRMEFVLAFAKWAVPEMFESNLYRSSSSELMRGTLLLGIGNFASKNPDVEFPNSVLEDTSGFYESEESTFVKASIEWMHRVAGSSLVTAKSRNMVKLKNADGDFEILNREITVGEFRDFLDYKKEDEDYTADKKPLKSWDLMNADINLPMHNVSKIDAILYCNWLSAQEGLDSCYVRTDKEIELPSDLETEKARQKFLEETVDNRIDVWEFNPKANGYRLPTRKEWGFAAEYSKFIKLDDNQYERYLADFAWYDKQMFEYGTQKMPNENGLFDVYGNANEFCWSVPDDTSGDSKFLILVNDVLCGGSIEVEVNEVVNIGNEFPAILRSIAGGFRIARNVAE